MDRFFNCLPQVSLVLLLFFLGGGSVVCVHQVTIGFSKACFMLLNTVLFVLFNKRVGNNSTLVAWVWH